MITPFSDDKFSRLSSEYRFPLNPLMVYWCCLYYNDDTHKTVSVVFIHHLHSYTKMQCDERGNSNKIIKQ